MRRCIECGGKLATIARAHAVTCSARCRKRRSRRTLPTDLTSRARWVRYTRTKAPLTSDGRPASSTDPSTWTTYAAARRSEAGAGLGFVLDGDGVACIDLDHCLTAEGVAPWAQSILDRCPPTYIETSPSSEGLHIWGRADVPKGRRIRSGGAAVEIYGTGRYLTVTGRRHGDSTDLADLSDVIAHLTA